MRRVIIHKTQGKNPLQSWGRIVGRAKTLKNFFIIWLCRYVPHLGLKNALYRLTGMKVGKDVSVGLMAMMDIFFPELISIGDNTVIGYGTVILAHEFLVEDWRIGRVEIGKNVMIGANCTVLPGVRIGDGAEVSACSLVNADVPAGARVGGVPARPIPRKRSKADAREEKDLAGVGP